MYILFLAAAVFCVLGIARRVRSWRRGREAGEAVSPGKAWRRLWRDAVLQVRIWRSGAACANVCSTEETELLSLSMVRRGDSNNTQSVAATTVAVRRRPWIRPISQKNSPDLNRTRSLSSSWLIKISTSPVITM